MAKVNFYLLLRSFARMPRGIQGEIAAYFLKRMIGMKCTDHQTIWTSFFYFSAQKVLRIVQEGSLYVVDFECQGKSTKTAIRVGDSTDIFVFFQVFIAEGYKPLIDFLKKKSFEPKTIVDAGANVGYFSLLTLCCYHPDILIALEPEKSNYLQLKRNMEGHHHGNVQLLPSAIWTERKMLSIQKRGGQEWATQVKDETTGDVCEALSLKEIMKNNEIDLIDILKLDVEGTEDILFRDVVFLETLNLVKVLGIEIHDDMASREMIHEELRKKRFDFFEQGELTVAWNKSHFHE